MSSGTLPFEPSGLKLAPNPNQQVGPTGVTLQPNVCKAFVEAVKQGDLDKFSYELMRNNIEVRDVIDIGQFNQNLAFTSV